MQTLKADTQNANNESRLLSENGDKFLMYQSLHTLIKETFGELPKNSDIKEFTSDYCIFVSEKNKKENLGYQTVRFNVKKCFLACKPDDSRDETCVPSEMTMAMCYKNNIVVFEGCHRVVYAYQGGNIPPHLGGVLGKPSILEYSFDPEIMPDNFFDNIIPVNQFEHYKNPYTY